MIEVLHRVKSGGKPSALFVSDRKEVHTVKEQQYLAVLVGGVRIHAWVHVKVGIVPLKLVAAYHLPPVQVENIVAKPPAPVRSPKIKFPGGGALKQYHQLQDAELAAAKTKYFRPGLWFNAGIAHGTLIGHDGKVYIIPEQETTRLLDEISQKGAAPLNPFDCFAEPRNAVADIRTIRGELGKPWWKFWG